MNDTSDEGTTRGKIVSSVVALAGRQAFITPLNVAATIIFSRSLKAYDFGAYAAASMIFFFAGGLAHLGLGAALIQQRHEPTREEQRTVFLTQLATTLVLSAAILFSAPHLAALYGLRPVDAELFRWMILPLVTSTLSSNSLVLLNRTLDFTTQAKIEVIQVLGRLVLAVPLALAGFGAWSLVAGEILSSVTRHLLTLLSAPWSIGFHWNRDVLRRMARFGVRVQVSELSGMTQTNVYTFLAGPVFGVEALGYLKWTHSLVRSFTEIIQQLLARVAYPAFSRMQDDPALLSRTIAQFIRYSLMLSLPLTLFLGAAFPQIVTTVYSERWLPGLSCLYGFAVYLLAQQWIVPLDTALKGTGRAGTSAGLMWGSTALIAGLAALASLFLPFWGISAAYGAGSLITLGFLFRTARLENKRLFFDFTRPIFLASAFSFLIVWLLGQRFHDGWPDLVALFGLMVGLYLGALVALDRQRLGRETDFARQFFKKLLRSPGGDGPIA